MLPALTILLTALGVHLALGVLFAVAFVTRGVERIDPTARAAGWPFRLLIFPGVTALWPLLLARWIAPGSDAPPPPDGHIRRLRRAHAVIWLVLGPLLLLGLAFVTLHRPTHPAPPGLSGARP